MKNKILLWGWFGFDNLGDDLLLDIMIKNLMITDIELTLLMKRKYNKIDSKIIQRKRSYFNLLVEIFKTDCLIIGPGGLFPFNKRKKLFIYNIITNICKILNKKVIYFGVGISDYMDNYCSKMWRNIVKKSNLFFTRSDKFFERIGFQENDLAKLIPDIVFDINKEHKEFIKTKKAIISVANLTDNREGQAYKNSIDIWSKVIAYLLTKGYSVDLIAFSNGGDDILVEELSMIFSDNRVSSISSTKAIEILDKWNEYDIAICMRFHSLVLSIVNNVKCVPIAYAHKTINLSKKFNIDNDPLVWNEFEISYFGEYRHIDLEELIKKINNTINSNNSIDIKLVQKYNYEIIKSFNILREVISV